MAKTRKEAIEQYKKDFQLDVFVKRINELLKDAHMRQADLANELHVDPITVSRWKNGTIAVPYSRIYDIANIFHVYPEYLYIEDAPRNLADWSQGVRESYEKAMQAEYDKEYNGVPYKALTDILKCMGYVCFLEEDTNNDKVRCVVYDSATRSETYLDDLLIKKLLSGIESTVLLDMKHNDRPDIPRK